MADTTALLDLFESNNKPLHPLSTEQLAEFVGTNALGQLGATIAPAEKGQLGIPVGFNPNDVSHMVMRIDPMPGGRDVRVTVGELRDMAKNQNKAAPQLVKESAAVAARAEVAAPVSSAAPMQRVPVAAAAASFFEAPVVEAPAPPPSPMQALKQSKTVQTPASLGASQVQAAAPSNEVLFEVQNVGMFNGLYHEVIIGPSFITLVFDLRWKAGKFFPNTEAPIAMQIVGVDQVFLVHTTNVQFSYGDYEFCVLLIAEKS
jgi:hypothetical protein